MRSAYATATFESEILAHEAAYYHAVASGDGAAVEQLTAGDCIVLSEQGTRRLTSGQAGEMAGEHAGGTYEIDDESIDVLRVNDDAALVTYRLRSGRPGRDARSDSHDASLWVRRDGGWVCAFHAEIAARAS